MVGAEFFVGAFVAVSLIVLVAVVVQRRVSVGKRAR